ncbi:hypothetical protein OG389_00300 [Streptomyces sp. NBC_00435]|uniref:hypothetical protein n=1 Tax=Streptomyces sp. NBC_00435 TaxID=2903649 RepID=UPI002E1BAD5E
MRMRHTPVRLAVTLGFAVGATMVAAGPSSAEPGPTSALTATHTNCVLTVENGKQACFTTAEQSKEYAASAGVLVATLYDWVNYNSQGAHLAIFAPRGCTTSTTDKDYRYADMPSGWNDKVSSVSTPENGTHCDVWFSSDRNFEGECGNRWIDKHWDLSQIGCFNRASSFELS